MLDLHCCKRCVLIVFGRECDGQMMSRIQRVVLGNCWEFGRGLCFVGLWNYKWALANLTPGAKR